MNWLVAFGSLCSFGTLVTVARFVFVAGTYKQRFLVSEELGVRNEKALRECDKRLNEHDTDIQLLGSRKHRGLGVLHAGSGGGL